MMARCGTAIAALVFLACSPDQGETESGISTKDDSEDTGGSGSDDTGSGTASDGGDGLGAFTVNEQTSDPDFSDNLDAACEGVVAEGEEIEVEIVTEEPASFYIMMDTSGSMVPDCGLFGGCSGVDKWAFATAAMSAFMLDPGSDGIEVALGTFSGNDCTTRSVPVVPMGILPGHATAFLNAMNSIGPSGNTPTEAALRGTTEYCAGYMAQNPDKTCVGVLVSDGQPTVCSIQDQTGLSNIAAQALANSNVRTFTIGMDGSDPAMLDAIAASGNGDCTPNDPATWRCDATSGQAALVQALQSIREQVVTTQTQQTTLECQWVIPAPPDGEEFDEKLINVQFRSNATASSQEIGRIDGVSDCANVSGGWYYDDPNSPTEVRVCPDTCTVLQSIQDARVEIRFGCASKPAVLK